MAQGQISGVSRWLTSPLVARVQAWATRLRFLLALPAAGAMLAFADRGPIWPGATAALFGEAIQVWSSGHLRKNEALSRSGPYAWVRNPMYLGRFLVGLGFVLVTWRWFLILPYLVIFWLYAQARVLGEECRLEVHFGEGYRAYWREVRRWLPRPPRGRLTEGRWSWDSVRENHELQVAAAVVAALVLLKWRMAAWGPLW